jgi:hypothetical protein
VPDLSGIATASRNPPYGGQSRKILVDYRIFALLRALSE